MLPQYLCGGTEMKVLFIRHGSAEPAGQGHDKDRQLTHDGRRDVEITAEAIKAMGIRLEHIISSSLARAMETARILSQVHSKARIEAEEMLVPPVDTSGVRKRLAQLLHEGANAVALVGHAPTLCQCAGELVADTRQVGFCINKAGAACIEMPDEESPTGARLCWLMQREQLALIATNGKHHR